MTVLVRAILNGEMKDVIINFISSDVYRNEDNSVISIPGFDVIDINHITFSE